MVEINIKASQGISQAIAEKLNLQGTRISKNVWEQVIGLVEAQNQNDGKIFGQNYGHDISGSGNSNFVVKQGKITIDDNIWNRICRLMGKPEQCIDVQSQTTDTDPAVKNTTIRAKAFTRITNALKNNQLGQVPEGFREALIKAYGQVDDINSETTEADYVRSLLLETQKVLGKTPNISEDMARRAMEYTLKICPDGELDGKPCSEYSSIDEWLENVGLKQNAQAINTNSVQQPPQVKFSKQELETKIQNIKTMLNNFLKGKTLEGPNNTTISGDDVLKIINNEECFQFENNPYGAARADAESGQILINLDGCYSTNSDAELMKLIIHEALHCVYKTPIDTQNEEYCCESQALKITAEIVNQEKNNPETTFTSFGEYGHNIEDFSNFDIRDKAVLNWLNNGYANRPFSTEGDISILKDNSFDSKTGTYTNLKDTIDIQGGDEIFVDGKKLTTIGEHYLESANLTGNGNSNICQLCVPNKSMLGFIVFDGTVDHTNGKEKLPQTEPKKVEIRRGNEIICTGNIYLSTE